MNVSGFKAMEMGIPSHAIRSQKDYEKQQERSERILQAIKESERVLDILRPVSPQERKINEETIEKWMKVTETYRSRGEITIPSRGPYDPPVHPNQWFADRFPTETAKFGDMFFGQEHVQEFQSIYIPVAINEDACAAVLGGDRRLGQKVVWFADEGTFYYYDFRYDAFCPTTVEKLRLLASNFLIRCAQDARPETAIAVNHLRTPQNVKAIISATKAMHTADASFFRGDNGMRRYVDGRYIEPNEIPPHQLFVKTAFVRDPEGKLTVGDAFSRYTQFCNDIHEKPLIRAEFKAIIREAIREEFQVGLRHDVPDSTSGKMTHGWRGINIAPSRLAAFSDN